MAFTLEVSTFAPGNLAGGFFWYEQAGGGVGFPPTPNPIPAPPANQNPPVIHRDQSWIIRCEGLTTSGILWALLNGEQWTMTALLEQIGPGEAPAIPPINFPVEPQVAAYTYDPTGVPAVPFPTITINPGDVPVGTYRIFCGLDIILAAPPLAGFTAVTTFEELGVVKIIEA